MELWRSVSRRVTIVALGSAAVLGCVLLVYQIDRYCFSYVHNRFNPRSLEGAPPTFYYLDWSEDLPDLGSVRARLDPDGVYTAKREMGCKGDQRHRPVKVIQAALGLHDQLLKRPSPEVDAIFRRQLDWLMQEAVYVLPDSIPLWPERYANREFGLHTRWVSALTQGQAISLLLRAARYTGDSTYALWAGRAVRGFTEGNLPMVWHGDDGQIFFEEYPCDPPAHVLNGCLLAWLGLWDYARFTGDPKITSFCLRSLSSIKATLPRYVIGDWTRYGVHRAGPTSPAYQEIHAALAETLHGIFPDDPVWADHAWRWRQAANSPWLRVWVFFRVLADKSRIALFGPGKPAKGWLLARREELSAGKG